MTLGTGIFLSSVFLGLVLLYIATKDRWQWKKVFLRSLLAVFGLILVIGGGIYAYSQYADRPVRAESMWDIREGASMADVKFAKGEPVEVDNEVPDRPRWAYKTDHVTYFVDFKKGQVSRILATGDQLYLPKVAGVSPYLTSLDELTAKLGSPSHISRDKDEIKRIYSFPKYNVAFGLEKGVIQLIAVGISVDSPAQFQ